MRKLAALASALVFSLALQARFTINFNDGWRFHLGDVSLEETHAARHPVKVRNCSQTGLPLQIMERQQLKSIPIVRRLNCS